VGRGWRPDSGRETVTIRVHQQDQVRHTKEDALTDREFTLLLEGADRMAEPRGFQARFILLVGGRLGLRPGEICHLDESWVNWRRDMIEIPRHDPCTKGKDGSQCGYCREMSSQMCEFSDDLTMEEALRSRWSPKTEAAARSVPFDWHAKTRIHIERFFDEYDAYPHSRTSINRRVARAAELAEELDPDDVYPHCLRATAASRLAARGLGAVPLQSLLGWAQLSTAQLYIKKSGEATRRELHQAHSRQ